MATGLVTYTNERVGARVEECKVAYANMRRLVDALIEIKGGPAGTNWPAVADATGASSGQTLFDNLDQAIAYMESVNDALSPMDKNAL